jgi:hypothetical protein
VGGITYTSNRPVEPGVQERPQPVKKVAKTEKPEEVKDAD